MRVVDFPAVTDSRSVAEHVVWLRFSDGVEGTVDLRDFPVRDLHDIAPEALYDSVAVSGPAPKRDYPREYDDARLDGLAECAGMPEISRFFGIVIRMFWREHEAPHIHAQYGEFVATMEIDTGVVRTQRFPGRALRLVDDWRERHRDELRANWHRMRRGEPPVTIAPLD